MIVIHEVIEIKRSVVFKFGVLKFTTLETKIRPRKLLRRLIKIYVVCFVSQEVKLYGKAYQSLEAIVNSVLELAIAF